MPVPASDTQVVILCGGLGTRLRDVTEQVPKPLVDIGNRPILWHIMKLYHHFGYKRFVLCLGYRSRDIKEYFLRYRENQADWTIQLKGDHELVFRNDAGIEDWEVTCVETGLNTGTGGRIGRIEKYIENDEFLLTYGDGVGSVDIADLVRTHRAEGRIGTVTGVRPSSRYGQVETEENQVTAFSEKPAIGDGLVSGGFFAFRREIFNYLSEEEDLFLEQGPLQKLARDQQMSLYHHEGFWVGMDTSREYSLLNDLWQSGDAPWKLWT